MQAARNIFKFFKPRHYCSIASPSPNVIEHLTNRTLIRISGHEVSEFMQGLITNDIHHLDHGMGSMYAMFLNTNGRILYDTLVYRTHEANTFILECDVEASGPLQKHLKMYRVRRKIDIVSLEDDFKIYALFNPEIVDKNMIGRNINKNLDGVIVPCNTLSDTQPESNTGTKVFGDLLIYNDPRVSALGSRIIAPNSLDIKLEMPNLTKIEPNVDSNRNYRWFRYSLGVGEGVIDLPPNNSFPLEANCDYLHGISFHKGCYIGQELTARTHHTGVVRKRLMPLFLNDQLEFDPNNCNIIHDEINLGKLRGTSGNVALGLIRIAKAIQLNDIKIGERLATTGKPNWWPLEAPKEKMSA